MRAFPVLLILLLLLVPVGVGAEGVGVFAGLQTVSFGGDLEKDHRIPSGAGPALTLAIPSLLGVPFDINLGVRNTADSRTREDVGYRWIEFGPRVPFSNKNARVRPEFFAGGGLYDLKIGDVDFKSGMGFFAGVGIEDFISDKMSGRFRVKSVLWKSDTQSMDAPSLNFSLMFGYHF